MQPPLSSSTRGTLNRTGRATDIFPLAGSLRQQPEEFVVMMRDKDPKKSKRAMDAMMQMVKLDVSKLKKGVRREVAGVAVAIEAHCIGQRPFEAEFHLCRFSPSIN